MDEVQNKIDELLNISKNLYNTFKNLIKYEINKDNEKYNNELIKLNYYMQKEKIMYKNINEEELNEIDRILADEDKDYETNLEKFFSLANYENKTTDLAFSRMQNKLVDLIIYNYRMTHFQQALDYTTEFLDEEENLQTLNTLILEQQIFNDLLELFICLLNTESINQTKQEIKEDLINYKHILVFLYGNDNTSLLNKNKKIEDTYIYSKYLFEELRKTDSGLLYNYSIIKNEYLNKTLYKFLYNQSVSLKHNASSIIDKNFLKALIMLYAEDYKNAIQIYETEKDNITKDLGIEIIFKNAKSVANSAKVLTLYR